LSRENKTNTFLYNLECFVDGASSLYESWISLDNDLQNLLNDKGEYPLKQSFDEIVAELYAWKERVKLEFQHKNNEYIVNKIVEILEQPSTVDDGECIDQIAYLLRDNGVKIFKRFRSDDYF